MLLLALGPTPVAAEEPLQIGIIDFYGLGRVPEDQARRALTFKEGDTVPLVGGSPPAFLGESERRLAALRDVTRAHLRLVCCEAGKGIVYVGLEGRGRSPLRFRAAPQGEVRLPADVVEAGADFDEAIMNAVLRGDAGEDDSQGHALSQDPASRAIQERFVTYAARDLSRLRQVLRDSSDAAQRALAAQILGYAADKQRVVDDLVRGMRDPSPDVRNNAMRALEVFAAIVPSPGRPIVRVPFEPFVELLNSPYWTDRNKASVALMRLSAEREPKLLLALRHMAMTSLVEMARWRSEGHALPALTILGRMAGQPDDVVGAAVARGERERIIEAALARR